MDIFKSLNKDLSWIKDRTIFLSVAGSIAQNLHTEFSDVDYRGIVVSKKEYFLGFNKNFEQWITTEPDDITIFNIKKFFQLAVSNNPNVLEFIFTDEEHHIIKNEFGKIIIDNREKFISKSIKERYVSYAHAQAHRAKNHKRWVDSGGIKPPPTREEFGLPAKPSIPKDQWLTIQSMINKKIEEWNCDFEPFSDAQKIYLQKKVSSILAEMNILSDNKWMLASRSLGLNENFISIIQKEKAYENLVNDYKHYLEWKKNRNPKRAALEEKVGYDAKAISNLIRLLKQGKEALETGVIKTKRTDDREELMSIKECKWSYEDIISYADKLEDEVKESYIKSKLPAQPDINYLNNLCMEIIERML